MVIKKEEYAAMTITAEIIDAGISYKIYSLFADAPRSLLGKSRKTAVDTFTAVNIILPITLYKLFNILYHISYQKATAFTFFTSMLSLTRSFS